MRRRGSKWSVSSQAAQQGFIKSISLSGFQQRSSSQCPVATRVRLRHSPLRRPTLAAGALSVTVSSGLCPRRHPVAPVSCCFGDRATCPKLAMSTLSTVHQIANDQVRLRAPARLSGKSGINFIRSVHTALPNSILLEAHAPPQLRILRSLHCFEKGGKPR